MTFKEFFKSVQDDPSQQFDTEEEILSHVKGFMSERINPVLPRVIPEEYVGRALFALDIKVMPAGRLIDYSIFFSLMLFFYYFLNKTCLL